VKAREQRASHRHDDEQTNERDPPGHGITPR
jgi:hypothetical protein